MNVLISTLSDDIFFHQQTFYFIFSMKNYFITHPGHFKGSLFADTIGGALKTFKKKAGKYDMKGVQDLLIKIKSREPKKQNITILLEPNIPYDTLVQAMDAARLVSVVEFAEVVKKELFPKISIGDAPAQAGSAGAGGK